MSSGLCFILQGTDKNLLNCGVKQSKKKCFFPVFTTLHRLTHTNFPHASAQLTIFPACTSHHSPETCAADAPSMEAPVCSECGHPLLHHHRPSCADPAAVLMESDEFSINA